MHHFRRNQLAASILLALALVCAVEFGLAAPQLVARAAPAATGGSLTVNSSLDNNSADLVLTLREALLIAKGGTGPSGLNRGMTYNEWLLVNGDCTANFVGGAYYLSGGCGAGITDTLYFNLASNTVITLNSPLPLLSDSAPTIIDGGGVRPIINAAGQNQGLYLSSSNNAVKQLAVENAVVDDFFVSGDSNMLQSVQAWGAGRAGFRLAGSSNTLDMVRAGIHSASQTVCVNAEGNLRGIEFVSGSQYNIVQASYAGCNALYGMQVDADQGSSGSHIFGPNNGVGVNVNGVPLPNADGIFLGANSNQVFSSSVSANLGSGIVISSSFNTLTLNTVISNGGAGVILQNIAQNNYVGCTNLCLATGHNEISANTGYGILMYGSSVAFNYVEGNAIGADPGHPQGNGTGIVIAFAHDNVIGDVGIRANSFIRNFGDGITLDYGAYNNSVSNYISYSSGGNGVTIQGGAHDNSLGYPGDIASANQIEANGGVGLLITGSTTIANSVINHEIYQNMLDGVVVGGGAHGNSLGDAAGHTVYAYQNHGNGVLISTAAHDNVVINSHISGNFVNGIEFASQATNNLITSTVVAANVGDGINQRSSAPNNIWSHIANDNQNAGMPVDVNTTDDTSNIVDAPFPVITTMAKVGPTYRITGTASASIFAVRVEVYRVWVGGGHLEGSLSYVGTVAVDGAGNWSLDTGYIYPNCFIAFETSTFLSVTRSTEFGPNSCKQYLPLIHR